MEGKEKRERERERTLAFRFDIIAKFQAVLVYHVPKWDKIWLSIVLYSLAVSVDSWKVATADGCEGGRRTKKNNHNNLS